MCQVLINSKPAILDSTGANVNMVTVQVIKALQEEIQDLNFIIEGLRGGLRKQ